MGVLQNTTQLSIKHVKMNQIQTYPQQQQQQQMAFLARQNRTVPQQTPQNYAYGRHGADHTDLVKVEQKLNQQQLYKQQLQRQIQEKEQRKKRQQQKIRKEDQKFMREIDEINRKENEKKVQEKDKLKKIEDYVQSPNPIKQQKVNQTKRPMIGNLNIGLRQQQQSSMPLIPRISLQPITYQQLQAKNTQYATSLQRGRNRPYLFEQNDQTNMYYEERIRRHKQQMELKLQELSYHINSTKDNIKVDQQIQKIKRRLRAKPAASAVNQISMPGQSRVELEYQNKFFNIPKKNNQVYKNTNSPAKSRALDYQSRSKFTAYKNEGESRAKFRTQNDDMYSLPDTKEYQNPDSKWGVKPGKDNYLSNREALDYEAEKILGKIDDFLNKVKAD